MPKAEILDRQPSNLVTIIFLNTPICDSKDLENFPGLHDAQMHLSPSSLHETGETQGRRKEGTPRREHQAMSTSKHEVKPRESRVSSGENI